MSSSYSKVCKIQAARLSPPPLAAKPRRPPQTARQEATFLYHEKNLATCLLEGVEDILHIT
jgi:hypothetical protein